MLVTPSELWNEAKAEHPDDEELRGQRYAALMREHGLLIDREPGDDSPLFGCGYDPRTGPRQ